VLTRRLLVLVTVLMGLTLLTAVLSPRPSTRAPAPPPASAPAAADSIVEASFDAADPRTVAVEAADVVRVEVTSDEPATVELVGLDQIETVGPETPAVFDLLADEPGDYVVLLRESGRRAGTLRVTPAAE